MSLENGGLNLTDIQNKMNTQRIKWMFYLVQLDPNDFTKIVANKVIGKLNAGYEGLDIFRAHINEMKPKAIDHFYKHAISACQKIEIRHNPCRDQFDDMHIFYNPHITSGANVLKPDKTCITFNILKVKDLVFQASVGHKQKAFNKIQYIRGCLPIKSGLQTIESYDVKLHNGWTSMQSCSSKQIYESLNSSPRFTHNQHFKKKWANILKTETDWSKVWKTVHGNKTGNKIKSDIFCQLHLNFFTPLMALKNQLQTSAICNLCRKHQAEQHHEILSCNVTKNLFD